MKINIDKFNKWRREASLDVEVTALNWSVDENPEGLLTIKGNMDDITKCLVILMNHWDKDKKKKIQYIKEDE